MAMLGRIAEALFAHAPSQSGTKSGTGKIQKKFIEEKITYRLSSTEGLSAEPPNPLCVFTTVRGDLGKLSDR
jgi:hypothetical protein